jgi:hypothetical protein
MADRKLIRSVDEIPDWFDIRNYFTARDDYLTAESRVSQILERIKIIRMLPLFKEPAKSEFYRMTKNVFHDIALMLNDETIADDVFCPDYIHNSSLVYLDYFKYIIRPVSEMTVKSISDLNIYVEEGLDLETDSIDEDYEPFDMDCFLSKKMSLLQSELDLEETPKCYVELDLRVEDSVIISQFKDWLVDARKRYETKSEVKTKGDNLLAKIKSYRLLAYIDLAIIWSTIENVKIKPSVLVKVLFPDDAKGESEIDKTIKPLAYSILNIEGRAFRELAALAHCPADFMVWGNP